LVVFTPFLISSIVQLFPTFRMIKYYLCLLVKQIRHGLAALRLPRLLAGAFGVLFAFMAHAQQGPAPTSFFADDAGARRAADASPLTAALTASRPLTLNETGLRAAAVGQG
jgi:hypothetical protein